MKKLIYTCVTTIALALAGCFDIKDEIFLEEKGSGTFQTTMDMSGMKDMMDMLKTMMPDSLKDGKEMDESMNIEDSLMTMWKDLEKIPGISQVKREKKGDMIVAISFRFADIRALNAAMASRDKKDSAAAVKPKEDMFSFSKSDFTCNSGSMAGLNDAMKGLNDAGSGSDSAAAGMAMLKAFMGDMKYTHIYHFPRKVQSVSNKNAKISEDGKTVTLELDLASGDSAQTLQNSIRLR